MTVEQDRARARARARARISIAGTPEPAPLEQFTQPKPGLGERLLRSVTDAGRAAAHGATLGFGDEITAAALAPYAASKQFLAGDGFDLSRGFSDVQDQYLGELDSYRDEHPIAATVAEIGGGLGTFAAAPVRAGLAVPAGRSLASRAGTGAAQSAGIGGIYGIGEAREEGIGRLAGGATTAAISAPLGALAPLAAEGVARGARGLLRNTIGRMGAGNQQSFAARKLYEALVRDGLTPEQASAKLAQMGPRAALADVGENTRRLAGSISRAPGRGASTIDDFVVGRQEGVRGSNQVLRGSQSQRITENIDDLVPENFYASRAGIGADSQAGSLYREAYKANQHVTSPRIERILNTPSGRRSLRAAVEDMGDELASASRVDPELTAAYREAIALGQIDDVGTVGVGRGLKLQTLNYVKRAIGDLEAAAKPTATSAGNPSEFRRLGNLRRSLTRELDDLDVTARAGPNSTRIDGGAYARARSLAADEFAQGDALQSGRDFMTRRSGANSEEVGQLVSRMGEQERHMFRVGAARAIKDRLGGLVSRADATKKLKGVPDLEDRVRLAFDDDEMFQRYIRNLTNEEDLFRTYAEVRGGSQTASRLAADADAGIDKGALAQDAASLFANPSISNALTAGGRIASRARTQATIPEGPRGLLADFLVGRDVSAMNEPMRAAAMSAARRQALGEIVARGGLLAAAPRN